MFYEPSTDGSSAVITGNNISGFQAGIELQAVHAQTITATIGDGTTAGSNTITTNATGVLLSGNGTSATITGNTFTSNGVQVQGADSSGFDTAAVLAGGNTFDRAVTVDDPGTLRPTIWSSIQAGVNAANSGDTVNVAAGTYTESVTVNKRLTLDGAGDTTVINANSPGITISASGIVGSPLVVRDLKVQGTTGSHGIQASGVDYITLENVTVTGSGQDGMHLSDIDNLVLTNVTATGNGIMTPPRSVTALI